MDLMWDSKMVQHYTVCGSETESSMQRSAWRPNILKGWALAMGGVTIVGLGKQQV